MAESGPVRITTDKFDNCARDRFVYIGASCTGARLAHSWLVATEEGITAKHPQTLSGSTQIKKIFNIPLPQCEGAMLCIFHGGGSSNSPMRIQFNDQTILHDANHITAAGRGWEYEPVAPELIRKGTNTLVFSGAGTLMLDTRNPNMGSAVSYDAGHSWHQAAGEYIVRLRISGYPAEGLLTSEALDTALGVDPKRVIGPWPQFERAVISADTDAPQGTEIAFQWRVGTTRCFSPAKWTPWQEGVEVKLAGARYMQWRAILRTKDGTKTPLLKSISLSLFPKVDAVPSETSDLRVTRYDMPENAPDSYEFVYEGATPRILYLGEKYKLASIPPAEGTDLDRTSAIRYWCSHQWDKGWDWGKYQYIPPWDALILMDMAPSNLCLGMCTHYSTLYVQASVALGYVSRHVILDYHCIAETYLNDLGKWVIQDVGPGAGPKGYPIGVHYEAKGISLNSIEMHQLFLSAGSVQAVPDKADGEPTPYTKEKNLWLYSRFGIPLRNNHLSVPEPAEEEHGQDHYHYNGYLWWTDNPDNPEQTVSHFSLLSNRPADFYPRINQTWIDLERKESRLLGVALSGNTPNFKQYEVRLDNGAWKKSESSFTWPLRTGTNTLAARSVNAFGIFGQPAVVEVLNITL